MKFNAVKKCELVIMNKNCSFRSHQTCKGNEWCIPWYCLFTELLISLPYQFINLRWKVLIYSKFMAHCSDVLADKPHHQFLGKILSKKVRFITRCLRYIPSPLYFNPQKKQNLLFCATVVINNECTSFACLLLFSHSIFAPYCPKFWSPLLNGNPLLSFVTWLILESDPLIEVWL